MTKSTSTNAEGRLVREGLRGFDKLPREIKQLFWYADNNYEVALAKRVLKDHFGDITYAVKYMSKRIHASQVANTLHAYGPDYPKIGGPI
jgi:hypothetical protein